MKYTALILIGIAVVLSVSASFVKSDANNGGFILQGILWCVAMGCLLAALLLFGIGLWRLLP